MAAARAVCRSTRSTGGACRRPGRGGGTGEVAAVLPFADPGDHFARFFGFAGRTGGFGFFTQAQCHNFKLLFAFFTLEFINRHTGTS